jgi:hypothetical protein
VVGAAAVGGPRRRPPALTCYQPGTYAPLVVYDVEFSGARGDRTRGRYLRSAGSLFTTCAESFEAVWAQAARPEKGLLL